MAIFARCKVQVFFLRKADTAGGGMEVRLNKNAYSTIDLSARRSAQMGIRMKKYLLFDLDGTLTDPKTGICTCVQYALSSMGIEEPDLDKLEPFIGPPLKDSFMKCYNMSEEQAQTALEKYRERFQDKGIFENKIYPGIPEMLQILLSKGMFLAVASSKPTVFVEKILEHFNIKRFFKVIVGSELDGTRVNKDEIVEEALKQLFGDQPVDKSQVYMIGDRSFDAEGAHKAGVESVGVTYGYGSMEELKEAKADFIVRSVEELQKFLLRGTEEQRKLTPFQRVWQLFFPLLLFVLVKAVGINMMGIVLQTLGNTIPVGSFLFVHDETGQLVALTGNAGTLMQIAGFVAGLAVIWKISRSTLRKAADSMKLLHIKGDPAKCYLFAGFATVGAVLGFNLLFSLSGIMDHSEMYQAVVEDQYSAVVWFGLLCYGFVTPYAEEVLFRGIIYNCMRRSMKVKTAIFVSAMIFGMYHMNAVQGIYAFLLGCIIAYAYEYFGDFRIPVVIHVIANVLAYCLTYTSLAVSGFVCWPVCILFLAVMSICLFLLHREKNIL